MPSTLPRQVGSCNCCFGACSAFTPVMACTLAESPSDPFHRKLRQPRCLRCRFDCYRVERTSSRTGVAPAEVQRLSRRTLPSTNAQTKIRWHRPSVDLVRLSTHCPKLLSARHLPLVIRLRRQPPRPCTTVLTSPPTPRRR